MKFTAVLAPVLTATFLAGSLFATPRAVASRCSAADTLCGGDKSDEKKDDKKAPKNPSVAQPQCGGEKGDEKKGDKKPST